MSVNRKPSLTRTFETWFKTIGGFVLKTFSSVASLPAAGYCYLYNKNKKLYIKDENGTEKSIYTSGELKSVEQLENSLAEICWYYYSDPKYLSNFATDDFDDESGIDSLMSNYVYDGVNDWIEPPLIGTMVSIADISLLQDIERWDAKGNIETWQATGEGDDSLGYFGITGDPNYSHVCIGCDVVYSGGSVSIEDMDDGQGTDDVTLSSAVSDDTEITTIYGSQVSGGSFALNTIAGDSVTIYPENAGSARSISAGRSYRLKIESGGITASASRIRIKITSVALNPYFDIQKASIGPADSGGPSCTEIPTEIVDWSGYNDSAPYAGSLDATCNAFDYDFDMTKDHILVIDVGASGFPGSRKYDVSAGTAAWYRASYDSYDMDSVSGFTAVSNYFYFSIEVYAIGEGAAIEESQTAITSSLLEVDTSAWGYLSQIISHEVNPGSSTIYHTVCFNRGADDEKWKIYSTDWRDIAKLDSGIWKYQDSNDTFQTADYNLRLHALAQAFDVSSNQMNVSVLQRIGKEEFSSVFYPGSLNFGWNLVPGVAEDSPTFDKYDVYYDSDPNLSLVTESFEAKNNDDNYGFVVIKIIENENITIGEHIKADISINNGIHWHTTELESYKEDGTYNYLRGKIFGITPRGDKTIRCRVRTMAMKDLSVVSIAIGVR